MERDRAMQGRKQVANWLLLGAGMIMVQVLLGGITRLTGSGLSITEWKPILGTIPPLDEASWQRAFDQYKNIGQYKHLNFDFTLADFKFIYFWEWFHRVWARLIGLVFLFPFLYFLWTKKISRDIVTPMVILFLLGALQGALGWIMVKSGLTDDRLYVSHIKLAIHFLAALGLLCYVVWFAMKLLVPEEALRNAPRVRQRTLALLVLLGIQLMYGAFMAGLKAGAFAPSWPDMNGQWWPTGMAANQGGFFLTDNPLAVQFIHRMLAYLLTLAILVWYLTTSGWTSGGAFARLRKWPLILVVVQLVLGIVTVLHAANSRDLLWWGVAHQFVAMLLMVALLMNAYVLKPAPAAGAGTAD